MSTSPGARHAPRASITTASSERRGVQVRADIGDPPVLDHHAAARVQAARRIEQARADDRLALAHAAARSSRVSVSRQAMRTATPSST